MGFWDKRVLDQVMAQLKAVNYAQYVKRLPSEYEANQEMLRVRLVDSFHVDMITVNAAWCFVLWGVENGVATPVGQRKPFSAGLPLGTTAKAVAAKLQAEVPVLQKQITDWKASEEAEATPQQGLAPSTSEMNETHLAGVGAIVREELHEAGFDIQVRFYSSPDAQISLRIAGLPNFSLMPSEGTWWFYWPSFPASIVRGFTTSNLDSDLPTDSPPRHVSLLVCYFILKTMIYGGQKEGYFTDGIGTEVQAAMSQSIRFLVESSMEEGMEGLMAETMLQDINDSE